MKDRLSLQLAQTIMNRYPNPDDFPFMSWCYSQGFMLMGFVHLYENTNDACYREYVLRYARHHVAADGSVSCFTGCSMDDMMAGAVIAWAYRETGEQRFKTACEHILSKFSDYPRTTKGGFWHGKPLTGEMWVDGVFMGGMFLTHHGAWVGNKEACFEEVVCQLDAVYESCHKAGGLLYHGWSENPEVSWADQVTGLSCDVWSEGLGWYALILAETVRLMPETMADKKRIEARFTQLLDTLASLQMENGLFCQVVDKIHDSTNWTDTSGSAMFSYAFAQAVLLGIGDVQTYRKVLEKAYAGLKEKAVLNEEGLIDVFDACDGLCVQNCFEDYINYPKVVNAKEATAAVLWAAEAVEWRL